jgi:hypothetical protein
MGFDLNGVTNLRALPIDEIEQLTSTGYTSFSAQTRYGLDDKNNVVLNGHGLGFLYADQGSATRTFSQRKRDAGGFAAIPADQGLALDALVLAAHGRGKQVNILVADVGDTFHGDESNNNIDAHIAVLGRVLFIHDIDGVLLQFNDKTPQWAQNQFIGALYQFINYPPPHPHAKLDANTGSESNPGSNTESGPNPVSNTDSGPNPVSNTESGPNPVSNTKSGPKPVFNTGYGLKVASQNKQIPITYVVGAPQLEEKGIREILRNNQNLISNVVLSYVGVPPGNYNFNDAAGMLTSLGFAAMKIYVGLPLINFMDGYEPPATAANALQAIKDSGVSGSVLFTADMDRKGLTGNGKYGMINHIAPRINPKIEIQVKANPKLAFERGTPQAISNDIPPPPVTPKAITHVIPKAVSHVIPCGISQWP